MPANPQPKQKPMPIQALLHRISKLEEFQDSCEKELLELNILMQNRDQERSNGISNLQAELAALKSQNSPVGLESKL